MPLRRPLKTQEIDDYYAVAELAAQRTRDFYAGAQYVIVAMLQSPSFLFQVEVGTLMEGTQLPGSTVHQLTPYELASRISLFLLDQQTGQRLVHLTDYTAEPLPGQPGCFALTVPGLIIHHRL